MAKKRVYELAKERGLTTHELVERLKAAGVEVKSSLASVEEADAERVSPVSAKAAPTSKKKQEEPAPAAAAAPAMAEPKKKSQAPPPAAEPTDAPGVEDKSTPAPIEKKAPTAPPSPDMPPAPKPAAPKPAAPKPVGPKIVATADEVRAAEQAAAARVAKIAPARRSAKGRGPRLDNIPTVVGPGVPVRKGIKPSSTVVRKGEEPPAPPPQPPKPEPKPPTRVDRPGGSPSGRPAGGPSSGRPAGGPPSGRPAGGPSSGRPAGGPPASRGGGAAPGPAAPARGSADKAGAARKRPGDGAPAGGGRLWKAGETSTRRRVVIDSQAGRRGGKGSSKGGRGGGFTAEVERAPVLKKAAPGTDTPVQIQSGAMVKDLADALEIGPGEIIKTMMKLGELVTITQSLSDDAIMILAEEFERKVEIKHVEEESLEIVFEDDPADLVDRAPVVTIMGHVDHGKTSLLDAIRETEVVKSEAGGITQHIGAYQVRHGDRTVTFIDTPGHEAFTAMRARGAKVTDVAVIVVAANDGVMPQTIEAIDHAKAAEVPMLVAINKIDLADSNPDKVKQQLSDHGLQPEEWGGDTVMVEVSAKKRLKLDELMDMILLVTEVQELKANPSAMASGTVVESQLDVGRGPVATILVQRGTLRVGDSLVSGEAHGKVKAMMDFKGVALEEAGPAVPAQVLGFNSLPVAGDIAVAVKDEREARQMAEGRTARLRQEMNAKGRATTSLDDFYLRLKEGAIKELALIVKGDVGGSVEALEEALANVSHPEVKVKVIHSGVGGINESDVNLAAASGAVIIGFNVRPSVPAKALADEQGVDIRTYRVIYKAIEDVQAALIGMLEPDKVEESLGAVEVRQIFRASRIGTIAGSYVVSGKITRNARVRVVRDGSIVFEGGLQSLKRFNDDVREVLAGFECGVHLDGFDDIKEGDIIEAYEIKEVARTK